MGKRLLQVTICFMTCFFVWSDDTNVDGNERTSTCRYRPVCYSPSWCTDVLSARECSNSSRCCGDVYNKVNCLKDMFEERTNQFDLSLELIDTLMNNASESRSQHNELRKYVDTLKTQSDQKDEKTSSQIRSLQSKAESLKSKLASLEKSSSDVINKYTLVRKEIETFKQRCSKTDAALNKLDDETKSNLNQLELLKTTISEQRDQTQNKISDITGMLYKNMSVFESKWQEKLTKESETVNKTFNSFDHILINSVKNLNTSIGLLNDRIENEKVKSVQDLHKQSTELKGTIESVETNIKSLESSFKTHASKVEADIKTEANNVYVRSVKTITEESSKLDGKINELSNRVNQETSDIDDKITQLTSSLTDSKTDLGNKIQKDTETLSSEIDRRTDELDKRLDELSANTTKEDEDINRKISEMGEHMEEYKRENAQNLETLNQSLTNLIQEKVSEVQKKTDQSIKEIHTDIDHFMVEIGELIKNEVAKLSRQTNIVNQTLNEQKEKVDIILPNTFNKEMFIIAFLVIVVLLAINYCIVYVLVKRTSPQPVVRRETTNNVQSVSGFGEEPHSPVEVYNRLTFTKSLPHEFSYSLKDSIGVISFYEDSQKHHKRLMKTVEERLPERLLHDVSVEYHVVRRHEQIYGIPHAKLCIMFVEFSERHVIIEEPGLGLGDLKRKTAEFVGKMGACLVIVYVKDPGSRHLKGTDLFNNAIHCAKSQKELVALSKHERFLSIYDTFNNNQTERLVAIIKANLDQTGGGNRPNLRLNLERK